ncbi:MAG TPA: hypothetical protein VHV82_16830 [Sporichthyaceae bacterium]|jgi:hypothetical protein|nr:hypothetical protein [Sporichthyaceae bacterium]
MLFLVVVLAAELERDLIVDRTRDGLAPPRRPDARPAATPLRPGRAATA